MEVKDFSFDSHETLYGFVNVGAKICEVIPGSIAGRLGVRPGWYIMAVDEEELPGVSSGMARRAPAATTDEVQELLRDRRMDAVINNTTVEVCFWTRPFACNLPDDAVRLEAQSLAQLKTILVERFGSVVAAWDQALDKDGSGQLDYKEFTAACRELGLQGSMRSVFGELDKDGGGLISINELDPTCQMDCRTGRCAVCTLPNPCEVHNEEDQKQHTLAKRRNIQNAEKNGSAMKPALITAQ